MRIFTSKPNVHRIIAIGTLFGTILSAPQTLAAAPLTVSKFAPRVQRPLVLAPEAPPTAVATTSPTVPSGAGSLLVHFSGATSATGIVGSTALTYSWSFGDGFTSTLAEVTHIFANAGNYNVVLTVTNNAGQSNAVTTPVTVTAPTAIAAPYTGVDIGSFDVTRPPASQLYSSEPFSGSLATCSNGIDIYSPPDDDFRFVYRPMSNDGEIVGRLVEMNRGAKIGKAGLIVRESLAADAKYIFIGTNGVYSSDPWAADARFTYRVQWRPVAGDNSSDADVSSKFPSNVLPRWFRITRALNTFTTWLSADGNAWTLAVSQTLPMPTTVYAGYAVTSIADVTPTPTNCAQFDGLAFTDNPQPPIQPTVVLSATPLSGRSPLIVQLDGSGSSSTGPMPGIKSYLWSFGDGLTSTEATVIHVYPTVGSYPVTLTVTNFDNISATSSTTIDVSAGAPTGTLPSPWQSQDILDELVYVPGSSNSATFGGNSVLATCGSGLDIQGTNDRFRFDYFSLTGDGEIKARMLSLSNPTGAFGNKAGIMIRSSIARDAAHISLLESRQTNPDESSLRSLFRLSDGADSTNNYVQGYDVPQWMRITRVGNTFTSYTSTNGTTWTAVETQTLTMPNTVLAGFAITSIDASTLSCAVFDNVAGPAVTPPPPEKKLVYLPMLSK